MRRTWMVLLALALVSSSVPALCWELSLRGEAEWRLRYISRTGPGDLFGDAEVAQSTSTSSSSIGFAGPQALAVRLEGYSSKGSDAQYAEQRFFLFPEFKINQAARIRAHITFQGNVNANYKGGGANWVTNPHYSGWTMIDSRDLYTGTGLAVPVLRALYATTQLPWGILAIGTRPAAFGMGWAIHEDDSYARSLSLIVPYGPLTFVFSQYLHDPGMQRTDPNDDRNSRLQYFTIASGVDKNESLKANTALALRYDESNLSMGSLLYFISRQGVHSLPTPAGTYQDDRMPGIVQFLTSYPALNSGNMPIYISDSKFFTGATYLKYQNGRFFCSGEFDFNYGLVRRDGGRPIDVLTHAWAAEAGLLAGPLKMTLAGFFRSGHDRRGGLLVWQTPTGRNLTANAGWVYTYDKLTHFIAGFLGGGDSPIRPYNFLIGLYGAGNNGYTSSGQCTFDDFLGLAGRLDYAAAANMNLFASFIWAERASNTSTPQGLFTGWWANNQPGNNQPITEQSNNPGSGTWSGTGIFPVLWDPTFGGQFRQVPNVPETDLGWEADAGMDWKILEGVTFRLLFAYWKPGKWFKWAYQDMTVSTVDPPTVNDPYTGQPIPTGRIWGRINPGRTINPIIAIQTNLLYEF